MDDVDRTLLSLLRTNARTPAAALAKKAKVSRATVQNRIARMEQNGVIQRFTVQTRPDVETARVRAIQCIAIEGERSDQVIKALRGFPEVGKIHTTNGRWDLVVELETDTLASFSRTLDLIRRIHGIASTETSLLLDTVRA